MSFLDQTLRLLNEVDRASSVVRHSTQSRLFEELDNEYILTIDMPGVDREDVKIELTDMRVISISAKRGKREYETAYVVPDNVDEAKITADLKLGVLQIRLGKRTPETSKISISIN